MAEIEGGYTIWSRKKMLYSELFYKKPAEWFKIWFYIVNTVNYLKNNEKYIRGQKYITYEMIVEATRATCPQVRNCIKYLKQVKQINTQKTPRGLVITVNNYDFYQNPSNYKNEDEVKQKSSRSQAEVKQKSGNIYNKEKKDKKKSIVVASKNAPAKIVPKEKTSLQSFVELYVRLFKKRFNEEPSVKWGQAGKQIIPLIDRYGMEKMGRLLIVFFKISNIFINESDYSLGVFYSQINRLIIEIKKETEWTGL